MAKKPRVKLPKKASKGDIIEVKTLASHVMESGQRKGKDGKPIPRMIINKFVVDFNGTEIFSADLHGAVSANPYLAFHIKAEESGTYNFTWTDDNGDVMAVSQDMTVA